MHAFRVKDDRAKQRGREREGGVGKERKRRRQREVASMWNNVIEDERTN